MHEFNIIRYIQSQQKLSHPDLRLGIGDDAAILKKNETQDYVICTDTSALNSHFTQSTPIESVAYKALASNLSDLAAMAATPLFYLLNLSIPKFSKTSLTALMTGFNILSERYNLICIGGDTIQSNHDTLSVTTIGQVEHGQTLQRHGAKPGDLICLSGPLGLASFAYDQSQKNPAILQKMAGLKASDRPSDPIMQCFHHWYYPEPQIQLGESLRNYGTAAIDISDGLISDLSHILKASQVGARINVDLIPGQTILQTLCPTDVVRSHVLDGGEDYVLCFTIPEKAFYHLKADPILGHAQIIGDITQQCNLILQDKSGKTIHHVNDGFVHFK